MISDVKGVPVHIHSKRGKYTLIAVYKDKAKLRSRRETIVTSILDLKCFAGGVIDRKVIAEQMGFVKQILSSYRRVRDSTLERLRYQDQETLLQFKRMDIGRCELASSRLIQILTIHGLMSP